MTQHWYPLRFEPILKEKIWGGHQLKELLNKTSQDRPFGESWEIAALPNDQSIVSMGAYKGKTLGDLCSAFAKAVLGEKVASTYGTTFPLLIKFIDAADDLSVQLHPDDTIAKRDHNSFGKTEMWYILHAEPQAQIIVGFNKEMDAETFAIAIDENTLTKDLRYIPVQAGDAFFIDAGLIHAIGKGVVLAEIQQTSDITYRVYDYGRVQADGSLRDLHVDAAKKAIDFAPNKTYRLRYDKALQGRQPLKHATYFKTDILQLDRMAYTIDRKDSFTILMVVGGAITISCDEMTQVLASGQTILLPAACPEVKIQGEGASVLEVYL